MELDFRACSYGTELLIAETLGGVCWRQADAPRRHQGGDRRWVCGSLISGRYEVLVSGRSDPTTVTAAQLRGRYLQPHSETRANTDKVWRRFIGQLRQSFTIYLYNVFTIVCLIHILYKFKYYFSLKPLLYFFKTEI